MKIQLLHISDIHAKRESGFNRFIHPICDLFSNSEAEKIIIVCTGDLTYSGDTEQFKAVSSLLKNLKREIGNKCSKTVEVIVVPGNHDLHYEDGFSRPRSSVCTSTDKLFERTLKGDMPRFSAFADFEREECAPFKISSPCLHEFSISTSEGNLLFYGINNAVGSTFKGETPDDSQSGSKGLIHITHEVFNDISEREGTYSFAFFHFPPSYFDEQTISSFREKVSVFTSCFFGHIHCEDDSRTGDYGQRCQLSAVGAFNNGAQSSQLAISLLDTGTGTIIRQAYSFDFSISRFLPSGQPIESPLNLVSHDSGLKPSESFLKEVISLDELQLFEGSKLDSYFVFPELSLREYSSAANISTTRITDVQTFIQKITSVRCATVLGASSSGKTSFLKQLFVHLQKGFLPVFASAENLANCTESSFKKRINALLEEEYQGPSIDLFAQEERKYRVLLLDDADKLGHDKDKILLFAQQDFGIIVLTEFLFPFLDVKSLSDDLSSIFSDGSVLSFKLSPFYYDKRKELSGKVYSALSASEGKIRSEKDVRSFSSSVNSITEKFLGPSSSQPGLLVLICQTIYKSWKSASTSSNIYNSVFRSHVTSLLSGAADEDSGKIDLFEQLLNRLAFCASNDKKYSFSLETASKIINEYVETYAIPSFDSAGFLALMCRQKLLIFHDNVYSFTSKDNLAYFAAQEYSRRLTENYEMSKELIVHLLDNIVVDLNSSILLFIALSTAPNLIELIFDSASKTCEAFPEKDFTQFSLFRNVKKEISHLSPFTLKDVKQISQNTSSAESDQNIHEEKKYNKELEEGLETQFNQRERNVLTITAYLSVLTAILPDFKTRIVAAKQRQCVDLIYSLSNKLLTAVFDLDEPSVAKLVEEIRDMLREKLHNKNISSEAIMPWIVDVFRGSVLSCYHYSASRAVTSLTAPILCDSLFQDSPAHSVERLMMASFDCAHEERFKNEAISEFDKSKDTPLLRDCVRLIVRRWLYDAKGLEFHGEDAAFVSKFFDNPSDRKELLTAVAKNKNKD